MIIASLLFTLSLTSYGQSLSHSHESYSEISVTDVAVEQNIPQIDQIFADQGISRKSCHSESQSFAWINAFNGASYPVKVYSCKDSKIKRLKSSLSVWKELLKVKP